MATNWDGIAAASDTLSKVLMGIADRRYEQETWEKRQRFLKEMENEYATKEPKETRIERVNGKYVRVNYNKFGDPVGTPRELNEFEVEQTQAKIDEQKAETLQKQNAARKAEADAKKAGLQAEFEPIKQELQVQKDRSTIGANAARAQASRASAGLSGLRASKLAEELAEDEAGGNWDDVEDELGDEIDSVVSDLGTLYGSNTSPEPGVTPGEVANSFMEQLRDIAAQSGTKAEAKANVRQAINRTRAAAKAGLQRTRASRTTSGPSGLQARP